MKTVTEQDAPSLTFTDALNIVAAIGRSGLVVLPTEPSEEMIEAGAAAGRIDRETARRVLLAAVAAAD